MDQDPLPPLAQWIESETAQLDAQDAQLRQAQAEMEPDLRRIGYHPNHDIFALGGVLAAAGMRTHHIGILHWWLARPWTQALSLLRDNGLAEQPAYLLRRLALVADATPGLFVQGKEYLRDEGLLIAEKLPRQWARERGKFGLGVPLVVAGLRAANRDALAGLWTFPLALVADAFATVASSGRESLRDLLRPLIAADHERLSRRGRQSIFLRARSAYRANCASFAAFDAQDEQKRWRSLPPTARQGFLIAATARALAIQMPRLSTRGEAADWLAARGANLRFNRQEKD